MHLAQTYSTSSSSSGVLVVLLVVYLAILVLVIAGMWKMFTKANEHGWAAIIPFYSFWVLLRIVGRPGWWLVLSFIPIVNIVVAIIVLWELVKSFSKSAGWFWGLLLLPFVFYPLLGFGDAVYAGPAGPDKWPAKA